MDDDSANEADVEKNGSDSLFSNSGTENQESDIDTSALISNILNKANSDDEYINAFKSHFNPIPGMALSFALSISEMSQYINNVVGV